MNCPNCGIDMRLYRDNDRAGLHGCTHDDPAPKHIVETLYAKPNEDLVALIERLQKVVDELERRVHSRADYRTSG